MIKGLGKIASAIIMAIGIILGLYEIFGAHDLSVASVSAIQVIQVYVQGLFIIVEAYIVGRIIESITSI